jgi:DNA-binding SARP family transcriptional activator
LEELVAEDIRRHAGRVLEDEETVRTELILQRSADFGQQQKADKSQIKALQSRLSELDRLTQSLYEDKVLKSVSESVFQTLMTRYEQERSEKTKTLDELTAKFNASAKDEQDIDRFMKAIRKYVAIETLDREMLLELIDYIEVGERFVKGNQKYRDITIHYKFVGKIT